MIGQFVVIYLQRFGVALVPSGQLKLKKTLYRKDFRPLDESCKCSTCRDYHRAYIHSIVTHETVACHLLTIRYVAYQVGLPLQFQ